MSEEDLAAGREKTWPFNTFGWLLSVKAPGAVFGTMFGHAFGLHERQKGLTLGQKTNINFLQKAFATLKVSDFQSMLALPDLASVQKDGEKNGMSVEKIEIEAGEVDAGALFETDVPLPSELSGIGKLNGSSGKVKVEGATLFSIKSLKKEPLSGQAKRVVILYFHGGGYVMGNGLMGMPLFTDIIKKTEEKAKADGEEVIVEILSSEYPLAPQNPYPSAMAHALYAYEWIHSTYLKGETASVFLGGDSAGGGICLSLNLLLASKTYSSIQASPSPSPAGLIMMSPLADMASLDHESCTANQPIDYLGRDNVLIYGKIYARNLIESNPASGNDVLKHPYISAIYADGSAWRDCPPMFIHLSDSEMLTDHIRAMGNTIKQANPGRKESDIVMVEAKNAPHECLVIGGYQEEDDIAYPKIASFICEHNSSNM